MKRIAVVFGTRPEAIKLAPVVRKLKENPKFDVAVIITSQHKEMLNQVLNLFDIKANIDLDVMQPRQSLFDLSARLIKRLEQALSKYHADLVVVQGDTTTTFIASLAAFYLKIPVAYVEAGLRSKNKYHPYPEEINRELTSSIADIHFAPTKNAKKNLLNQGIVANSIHVVGNTVIDSLLYILGKSKEKKEFGSGFVLVTAHRRENWGKPIENLCLAIKEVIQKRPNTRFIFSVHKNPVVRDAIQSILGDISSVKLVEPLDYDKFICSISQSHFVLSDSGGVQEEAPALGKPVLVFRKTTERPEGVKAGVVKLLGSDKKRIAAESLRLLENRRAYKKMSKARYLYGDGTSSEKISRIIEDYLVEYYLAA